MLCGSGKSRILLLLLVVLLVTVAVALFIFEAEADADALLKKCLKEKGFSSLRGNSEIETDPLLL